MSTNQYKNVILRELEKLNERIDLKILRGKPYRELAHRHKSLLSQLNYFENITRRPSTSTKFFSFFL
jgi:hypothetical protein